jgi:hypothetical protein
MAMSSPSDERLTHDQGAVIKISGAHFLGAVVTDTVRPSADATPAALADARRDQTGLASASLSPTHGPT